MKKLLILIIQFYQQLIAPCLPVVCRFLPSCSQYTKEALQQFGLIQGLSKGVWRVFRCHPFSQGGYDPL